LPSRTTYSWSSAGFNSFFRRSIDNYAGSVSNLNDAATFATRNNNQELNFDSQQTRGALGDVIQIGKRVVIDGSNGRISVNDQNEQEVVRLGDLGD